MVDECHTSPCRGVTVEQTERPLKSIIITGSTSAVCLLPYMNTWLWLVTWIHFCSRVFFWRVFDGPQPCLSMYVLLSGCLCVCVRLCVWRYNSHHYLSQYPHVHVLIMLSMSNEVSQAAESLVDLFGLLLRPHSEIKYSWATSRARLLALLTASQLYKQHQIHDKAPHYFISSDKHTCKYKYRYVCI